MITVLALLGALVFSAVIALAAVCFVIALFAEDDELIESMGFACSVMGGGVLLFAALFAAGAVLIV